ncbi:MAG: methyl-accepting chemotaxis protein [Desulfobacterales bacterium]|nr:methyl-accepting chemotaxis protein [Desulfobacterales bacterium]
MSIKKKLIYFTILASTMILLILGTTYFYYLGIEDTNRLKDRVYGIVEIIQTSRIYEKTYLQFYLPELKNKLHQTLEVAEEEIDTLISEFQMDKHKDTIQGIRESIDIYKKQIDVVITIHLQTTQLSEKIIEPVSLFIQKMHETIKKIEAKQAELQIEGGTISNTESEMLNVGRDCNIIALQLSVLQQQYLRTSNETYLKKFQEVIKKQLPPILGILKQFSTALNDKEIQKNIESGEKSIAEFTLLAKESQDILKKEQDAIKTLDNAGNEIINVAKTLLETVNEDSIQKRNIAIIMVIIIVAIGILIFSLIGYSIIHSIIQSINHLTHRTIDLVQGDGDLTQRLQETKDEMGELARWFNRFIEKIQSIIHDISKEAGLLTSASDSLTVLSNEMQTTSNTTSSKSYGVARFSSEMSRDMNSVSNGMEEASSNISVVASAIEQMTSTIHEIAKSTESGRSISHNAVSQSKIASDTILKLGNDVQGIDRITETISEISEQTNLLALNATIEAARAGDAGKGFAVVANEIKELARQTAAATREIKNQIDGIQKTSSGTVTVIEEISKVINEVNDIISTIAAAIEELSVTSREIANNVAKASQEINKSNDNVAKATRQGEKITSDIEEVNQASKTLEQNIDSLNNNVLTLNQLGEVLMEMVRRFKIE